MIPIPANFLRWLLPLVMFGVAACTPAPPPGETLADVPADFSLVFNVQGSVASDNPLQQSSQTILEPNLRLRAAVGSGAGIDYYPPLTRVLEPAQRDQIWALVRDHHLLAEPISPRAQAALAGKSYGPVLYHLVIRIHGRTHRYSTTPEESPSTAQLLARLVEFRHHASPASMPPVPLEADAPNPSTRPAENPRREAKPSAPGADITPATAPVMSP